MQTYTFELTPQDVQVVFQGLGELPLKHSANVFGKMQQSVAVQDAKVAVPLDSLVPADSK